MQVGPPENAKKRGRPFQPGNPGGPGRPARADLVARVQVSGTLTVAGRISLKLRASQLQALWERSQERELTSDERSWYNTLAGGLNEELRIRGMLTVELLKLGRHDVAAILAALTGEEQDPPRALPEAPPK